LYPGFFDFLTLLAAVSPVFPQQGFLTTIQLVEAAYNPKDVNTTQKITACLNTLGIETKLIIKLFMSNPHLITALLHLHDIPV